MKRLVAALILAIIYLVPANVITIKAMYNSSNEFLNSTFFNALFAPYGFIIFLCTFNTWDWKNLFVLEGLIFALTIVVFYGVLILLSAITGKLFKSQQ